LSVTSFTDGICSPLIWTLWDRSKIMQNWLSTCVGNGC
jgi:hypothetical protein